MLFCDNEKYPQEIVPSDMIVFNQADHQTDKLTLIGRIIWSIKRYHTQE